MSAFCWPISNLQSSFDSNRPRAASHSASLSFAFGLACFQDLSESDGGFAGLAAMQVPSCPFFGTPGQMAFVEDLSRQFSG
jgi:hypothetical protein